MRPADPDALQKWREWHAEQDARSAEERAREEQHTKRTHTIRNLRHELHTEIAAVRAEMADHANVYTEATGQVLGTARKEITAHIDTALQDIRAQYQNIERELFRLVERRFAELAGRLDLIAPETRSRADAGFRFASEKQTSDDVVDMPNPIAPRGSELNRPPMAPES